ncbi:MAG: AGE family epimerase/isomerase [Proteobacteria bacterium]|nr:AGE family epimerase/isomerase [Pseudomonadota bacterium]
MKDLKVTAADAGPASVAPRLGPAGTTAEIAQGFSRWLQEAAWPFWWERGADHQHGGFHEAIDAAGAPVSDAPRRARVQTRQIYCFATAGAAGWNGPWREAVEHGRRSLQERYRRPDGLFRSLVAQDGSVLDDTALLYDQAFALLAMAAMHKAGVGGGTVRQDAQALLRAVLANYRHPEGGFAEKAPRAFQSNPQMHLFEAALAWLEIDPSPVWSGLCEELASLCLNRFIDGEGGFLREFFQADWSPRPDDFGRLVEPGHQFEWAWLLERWGRLSGSEDAKRAARRLFDIGLRGVDPRRGVAVNELWDDLSVRSDRARLWPQTEWLKAAVLFADDQRSSAEVETAARGLLRYLHTPRHELWRDKMEADGSFVSEPAPASSFYHICSAILELERGLRGAEG